MDGSIGLHFILAAIAIFLSVAALTMGAFIVRSVRLMRQDSQQMQTAFDTMRESFDADARERKAGIQPSVEQKLEDIATAARQAETAVATFQTQRNKAAQDRFVNPFAAPEGGDQPPLALGLSQDPVPEVSFEDMIKALNFPDDADDKPGFAALRRALKDRAMSQVIQAAQDILTLLSEDGIYMDDLRPDRAQPDLWRRYASGERGAMITALGGVRDRSSLALVSGRMRQDPVFRDTTHQFLRRFDTLLQKVNDTASDAEMAALTNTRSARAFMLLGRVTSIFD